jgi:hypothetical protein
MHCPVCQESCTSRRERNVHLKTCHADISHPFVCHCGQEFASERTLARHSKNHSKNHSEHHSELHKETTDVTLESHLRQHDAGGTVQRWQPPLELEEIEDYLEAKIHERITEVSLRRVADELQHVSYFYDYHKLPAAQWCRDLASYWRRRAGVAEDSTLMVHLFSPYDMLNLRNRIVTQLDQRLTQLLPSIIQHCRYGGPVAKELLQLRCWLDLAWRFTGIALRTQATQYLKLGPPFAPHESCVAFLTIDAVWGTLKRVLYKDKVGQWVRPTEVPLDETLSLLTLFWVLYVRPSTPGDQGWVFPNTQGGMWYTISKDLKDYLESLGVPARELDPSGRFIHASRTICLATYGLQVQFNVEKMRRLAILMRHNWATQEKYYLVWSRIMQSRLGAAEFAGQLKTQVHVATLQTLPYLVQHTLQQALRHCLGETPHHYEVRDQQTQTDWSTPHSPQPPLIDTSNWYHPASTVPWCCGRRKAVFGPVGTQRHRYFGRYYIMCPMCHQTPHEYDYYPPGFVPPHTLSTKSRTCCKMEEKYK